ncbi:MAG: hypothetical protein COB58_10355 [Thalassobium sp.]|jgi:hypothetical protein|nr:hypothetical protein R615_16335 [Thalassolituus oleivorans R6-15]PHQ83901.1 MAG: hypothetical protein COB58_12470 [Thalassobium sp.]PHQ84724.1 MAG: hypothetical protein COB58_10355 [Thalassobium sp.]
MQGDKIPPSYIDDFVNILTFFAIIDSSLKERFPIMKMSTDSVDNHSDKWQINIKRGTEIGTCV